MTLLICPVRDCGEPLERRERALACPRGHSFDLARSGYANLLQPQDRRSKIPGDSPGGGRGPAAAPRRGVRRAAAARAPGGDRGARPARRRGGARRRVRRGVLPGLDRSRSAASRPTASTSRRRRSTWRRGATPRRPGSVANADRSLPYAAGSFDLDPVDRRPAEPGRDAAGAEGRRPAAGGGAGARRPRRAARRRARRGASARPPGGHGRTSRGATSSSRRGGRSATAPGSRRRRCGTPSRPPTALRDSRRPAIAGIAGDGGDAQPRARAVPPPSPGTVGSLRPSPRGAPIARIIRAVRAEPIGDPRPGGLRPPLASHHAVPARHRNSPGPTIRGRCSATSSSPTSGASGCSTSAPGTASSPSSASAWGPR